MSDNLSYLAFVVVAERTFWHMFCYRSHASYSPQYALETDIQGIYKCQTEQTVLVDQMRLSLAEIHPFQEQLPFLLWWLMPAFLQWEILLGTPTFVAVVVEVWAFVLLIRIT